MGSSAWLRCFGCLQSSTAGSASPRCLHVVEPSSDGVGGESSCRYVRNIVAGLTRVLRVGASSELERKEKVEGASSSWRG